MGLLYGENCVILASTVFDWSTRVTDRRTDGQTDRPTELPWHIRAIAYMLSRVKIEEVQYIRFEREIPSLRQGFSSKHFGHLLLLAWRAYKLTAFTLGCHKEVLRL